MKKGRRIAVVCGVVVLAVSAFANAGMAQDFLRRGLSLLDTFDANADGTLTQAEVDQVRNERLSAFDTNNDGNLTLDEYEMLWMDAMRERMIDQFQDHDDDGNGIVTAAEFADPYRRLVARMDADGDGTVTRDEMRSPSQRTRPQRRR